MYGRELSEYVKKSFETTVECVETEEKVETVNIFDGDGGIYGHIPIFSQIDKVNPESVEYQG